MRTIIDDSTFHDHLKLMSRFVRLAGYDGLLVCLDEMVNLYKLGSTQARNANYEQILRILNDTLQGSAAHLGFVFGGTPEFLADNRRGLYSYAALQSRLAENTFASGGLVDRPRGILLITPESLEALFVLRGWKMGDLTAALRYIVIDELHSFIGTERGAQLQSLMHRLDLAARRHVPRIGLSATLGDMSQAADFLRPGAGERVTSIGLPDAADLASLIPDKRIDKYDDVIGESLLTRSYAARKLDVPGTEQAITTLADQAAPVQAAQTKPPVVAAAASRRYRLGSLPYAVVDVETTSTDAHKARIVEIAIIRLHPDSSDDRLYSTIVDSGTGPGPTHIHGLTIGDLVGAPRFAEIVGDIAAMLDGAVIVAHNARHDTEVLSAEFARLGAAPDDLLSLCTLALSRRFGPPLTSHRLTDCAAAEGIDSGLAHSAESDARTCAHLLRLYLERAKAQDLRWFHQIGTVGNLPITPWVSSPPTGRSHRRPMLDITPAPHW
ncbi:BREX system ATP-binding domain-containing protein [Streptosporangium sp. NPDC049248]|uniref:BREX system ATP-binding domain-containing protein n=1 Tax=Streptosporangium sp. NPDC049248 TaxID=3155651 RepID=UPI00343EF719